MKNKFYLLKKPRTFIFVQIMLVFGLFTGSLQAQVPTHFWKGGTGDWEIKSNWFAATTAVSLNGGATTNGSAVVTVTDTATAVVGDYISGTNIPFFTTIISVDSGTQLTLSSKAAATTASGITFTTVKPALTDATTYPGQNSGSVAIINSGTATLTTSTTNSFKLALGNTDETTQGKLIIPIGVTLTNSNSGGGGLNQGLTIRGGLIENNGTMDLTVTSQNGACVRFENPTIAPTIDWGIIGNGNLILKNTNNGTSALANGGLLNFNNSNTPLKAPKVFINTGSTATTLIPAATDTYALLNLNANSNAEIGGVGITAPRISTFKLAAGSVLTINSGVTLIGTSTVANTMAGTINNSGTIISLGLLNSSTGTINNVGSGTLINKALTLANNPISTYIFTTTSTSLGALAVGDTYTVGGVTYTIAAARVASALASVLIVTTAPTFSKPPPSGSLTKVSSASGSATMTFTAVAYNPYGGYLSSTTSVDNVTQDRYLSSNQRGWRLLSNPLTDVTYGSVATASTTPLTLGNGTAKTYDSATNTWTISNTDDTQTWASKSAVSLFVRGRTSEVTSTTYSVSPPSNVTVSVTGTASNAAPTTINTVSGQYYLVANPYTAPVSVSSILGASTGLSTTVSYYNPTVGSSGSNADLILKYGGYNNPIVSGVAGSTTDVIIPPMGAFFVQATSDGTIDVPKTAIFTGTATPPSGNYTHKTAEGKIASTNDLKVEVNSEGTYYDTVAFRFKAVGDAGSNIDFGKLPNTVLDAYSIAGANKMAVSELELKEQLIPLGLSATIQKSFTFKVVENTIPAGYEAVLVDNVLNTNTVLTAGTEYNFAIDSNPASQGDARFAINLKTAGTLGVGANEMDSKIQMWPNPTSGQLNISNSQNDGVTAIEISAINGQLVHSQKSNPGTTTTIQTNNWAKGVYILKASNNGNQTTKKLIIQ